MTELQHVLDRLRLVSSETWVFGFVLLTLIGLPLLQAAIWLATWSLFSRWPMWQQRIRCARQRVKEIAETFHITTPAPPRQIVGPLGEGDLSHVELANINHQLQVIKRPRTRGGKPLLAKEQAIVTELRQATGGEAFRRYLPTPTEPFTNHDIETWSYQWREGFYSAEEIMRRYPAGLHGRHIAWMFNRTLEVLGFAHRAGWVHGAVLPPHLLFHAENHGLQLIGWTHAERLGEALQVASKRFRDWYPPECHRREAATEATDIFLAASSMIALAGGDPRTGNMTENLPFELQRLLKECLQASPAQRPDDAWELRDRLEALLRDVYGRRTFCRLVMS